ncbi:HAMP domain-containing protein [Paenibacillus sp. HN-1]|uniref:HAMP domain-containing sensor histidine kinase n=1 Tax=Paenibacillus TaxID=44249 RepID=UPI001CA8A7F3|nr:MULTISPECIES: ATP-binding protein [Paenibacillus]MBY9081616.1 HAMP domain-containing protein [Paenibacillus sp. CGMCC 1.18879]MBY9083485.1 HAMP domain-containing protein [Paenibacillus sinensis]
MNFWRSLVGKLWVTIICLVAIVLMTLGLFLLPYIDSKFSNSGAIKRLYMYTGMIGFSMTTFFALFLFTKITQPMQRLIEAANAIRRGEYGTRVNVVTSDEIGVLATSFNHMAAELESNIRSLNHEKGLLSNVLRSMSDPVITFDNEGSIVLTNPHGQDLLERWSDLKWEHEGEEAFPEPSGGLSGIPLPLRPLFLKTQEDGGDHSDNVHVRQGVWSVHMAPLYTDKEIQGAVAVLRDVTEEVRLEKMRRDFLANVSHEIRTPLSMMQGYSEALLDGMATSPEESSELIQVIHDESLRMGRLVKDLLDLARMEAGHSDMNRSVVNVSELLERIYRKFSVRAKERNIDLRCIRKSSELWLHDADEDKLEQVLTNLLDNAFRHTPEGRRIDIVADWIAHSNRSEIEIEVRDEGAGIPSEDLPFIFERFYKADKARVRGESVGTGLGLAIVKNIVESHGGHISAASRLGEGTCFTMRLPVEKA